MKLSADKESPHYNASMLPARVVLDGNDIRDVVFADEEEGYALVLKRHNNGDAVTDGNNFVYEKKAGKIEIIPIARQ
ncbi:MAG: hypothetical protein E5X96_00185 [Mesorhizobium sp.]|nr:MAG: hypothetical protein E5X96_00185 [Mesorhizobium sp.]